MSSVYIPWLPKYKNAHTKECIDKGVKKFASSRTDGKFDEESIRKFTSTLKEIMYEDIDEEQAFSEIIATLKN